MAVNLLTMLTSPVSSIAGRYVVAAAAEFRSGPLFRHICIMPAAAVLFILISARSAKVMRSAAQLPGPCCVINLF